MEKYKIKPMTEGTTPLIEKEFETELELKAFIKELLKSYYTGIGNTGKWAVICRSRDTARAAYDNNTDQITGWGF